MAKEPTKNEERKDAEQEVFMREVDEAVRQEEASQFAKKYGLPVGIATAVGLAAFGGFLFWQNQAEQSKEEASEQYIAALDEMEAGNNEIADEELAAIAAGNAKAAAAISLLTRAGIALEAGRTADAVSLYAQAANNEDLPQEMRDLAKLREITAAYDTLTPQEVIDRIGPLANEGSTYYAHAAELLAHAYLAQNKPKEAGPLLVAIAKNEDAPETLRARARQLSGLLGFDAIDDVEETMAELGAGAPAAPAQ